jgi:hypothetical protein
MFSHPVSVVINGGELAETGTEFHARAVSAAAGSGVGVGVGDDADAARTVSGSRPVLEHPKV